MSNIPRVFISYARSDEPLVKLLTGFLRAANVPVFRDQDSILPGKNWRIEITEALDQCELVFVFWCGHTAQSREVKREYRHALNSSKRVIPVFMDGARAPRELARLQGIDLRPMLRDVHPRIEAMSENPVEGSGRAASENARDKVKRNRPPRVQITYEVDKASARVELPFVIGVLSDLGAALDESKHDRPGSVPPPNEVIDCRLKHVELPDFLQDPESIETLQASAPRLRACIDAGLTLRRTALALLS